MELNDRWFRSKAIDDITIFYFYRPTREMCGTVVVLIVVIGAIPDEPKGKSFQLADRPLSLELRITQEVCSECPISISKFLHR